LGLAGAARIWYDDINLIARLRFFKLFDTPGFR